jgi:HEAT repeat protein
MPVTREQVERLLNVDEPDYPAAARLGRTALPILEEMARNDGPALGLKAVHLASLIAPDAAFPVIDAAASRADPIFRVTAASVLNRLPTQQMADIAVRLVADPEESVRRRALESLPNVPNRDLAQRLQDLADSLAAGTLKKHVLDAQKKVS